MRFYALLPTVLASSAMMSAIGAQQPRVYRVGPGAVVGANAGGFNLFPSDQPRAVIGISTTNAASSRDTLGVLVSTIRQGSPAEKAGLEEGNRIASVNGVSLKLSPADIGDGEMAGVLSRRLTRELDKLKPGDELTLQVYANGQTKTVRVKTVAPEDLYETRGVARLGADRPTLGLHLAVTGSSRDTLGVFVMSAVDGGPAAKAGIEEGSRIASINGVDVRAKRGDEDEMSLRTSGINRLERELAKLKAGDQADLRVFYNGQSRNVKVTVARASDLPPTKGAMVVIGGDRLLPPATIERLEALPERLRIELPRMQDSFQRALDGVRIGLGGRRVVW